MYPAGDLLKQAVKTVVSQDVHVSLEIPDEQFGDLASNVAMQLAKKSGQNPREVAQKIIKALPKNDVIAEATVAGPGFINLRLTDQALWQDATSDLRQWLEGEKILLEYSCPNAFKELHTGHLYQTIVGDTMGRIFQAAGGRVFRANFGGDVGLHVARSLWGIQKLLAAGDPPTLDDVPADSRAQWISKAYVLGAKADTEDKSASDEIKAINQKIYEFHAKDDHQSDLAQIYWRCREWSYNYFKDFYRDIEVAAFDKYYPESETTNRGIEIVKKHIGTVFKESDGAIVFKGEDQGLHTRVFITSAGLPTYETKDLGVIFTEADDFPYYRRFLITGNDQVEYMKVVFAALKEIDPKLAAKQTHKPNGTVKFGDGQKMSSRLGNVTRAVDVLDAVIKNVEANSDVLRRQIALGAVKYSFLKQRLGGDIAFDVSESVSLQGNSGPYLQYAHARARSILAKAPLEEAKQVNELSDDERSLVRKLSQFNRVVSQAGVEFLPHYICNYLYELSQTFNRFYENSRVIGDPRQAQRLALVKRYAETLKIGLDLLNIPTPEKM